MSQLSGAPDPLAVPLHGPGLPLPRGAIARPTTHVRTRPDRGWLVAVIAAVVVVVAALAIITATRRGPAPAQTDDRPTVVRMNPIAGPSVTPIPAGAGTAAGSGAPPPAPATTAPAPWPGAHRARMMGT